MIRCCEINQYIHLYFTAISHIGHMFGAAPIAKRDCGIHLTFTVWSDRSHVYWEYWYCKFLLSLVTKKTVFLCARPSSGIWRNSICPAWQNPRPYLWNFSSRDILRRSWITIFGCRSGVFFFLLSLLRQPNTEGSFLIGRRRGEWKMSRIRAEPHWGVSDGPDKIEEKFPA